MKKYLFQPILEALFKMYQNGSVGINTESPKANSSRIGSY